MYFQYQYSFEGFFPALPLRKVNENGLCSAIKEKARFAGQMHKNKDLNVQKNNDLIVTPFLSKPAAWQVFPPNRESFPSNPTSLYSV